MEKLSLTPIQIIQLWNSLGDIEEVNEDAPADFTAWVKRFRIIASQEVELWNTLSIPERMTIIEEIIELPIKKLSADASIPYIPNAYRGIMQLMFDGEIPEDKPRIQQVLEIKKDQNKETE